MIYNMMDIRIGWLLFLDYLKECWKPFADISEERLMAPSFTPGYSK